MHEPVAIIEVIGRSEQGMTRPFLCRADDWMEYYVKGAYAGKKSVCREWLASRLANLLVENEPLGLPPFRMAEVPKELVEGSGRSDIRDLGEGRVFASMRIEAGQELNWAAAQGWPDVTMAMVMLIDLLASQRRQESLRPWWKSKPAGAADPPASRRRP